MTNATHTPPPDVYAPADVVMTSPDTPSAAERLRAARHRHHADKLAEPGYAAYVAHRLRRAQRWTLMT